MKALETPEEKRARRVKKKVEKERRRREKMGWDKNDLVSFLHLSVNDSIFVDCVCDDCFAVRFRYAQRRKDSLIAHEVCT